MSKICLAFMFCLLALCVSASAQDLKTTGPCSPINNNVQGDVYNYGNCYINQSKPFERPPSVIIYGFLRRQEASDRISFNIENGSSERGDYGSLGNIKSVYLYTFENGNVSDLAFLTRKNFEGQFFRTPLYNKDIPHYGIIVASCVNYSIPDKEGNLRSVQAYIVHDVTYDVHKSEVSAASAVESFPEGAHGCAEDVLALIKRNKLDQLKDLQGEGQTGHDFDIEDKPPLTRYAPIPNSSSLSGKWSIQFKFKEYPKPIFWDAVAEFSLNGSDFYAINGSVSKMFLTENFDVPDAYLYKSIFLRYRFNGRTLIPSQIQIPVDFMRIAREAEKQQLIYEKTWIECRYVPNLCSFKWMQGLLLGVKQIKYGLASDNLDHSENGASEYNNNDYPTLNSFRAPVGDKLYMQITFFDDSRSEIRSTPLH